jgi:hypothetical protein
LSDSKASNFELQSVDNLGNEIKIKCTGVDDKELAHFGGLDLHVKTVKTLIENTNGMSFAEQEGDYAIQDKVTALYLNHIGQFIRDNSIHKLEGISNMDLVKNFLDQWDGNVEVVAVVERENERNAKVAEEAKKEEDAIWDNIKLNSK